MLNVLSPWLRRAAVTAVASAGALPAVAIEITGSFSGVATARTLPLGLPPPRPVSDYDGQRVEGSFRVNLPDPVFHQGDETSAYFLNGNGGSLLLTFGILGERFSELKGSEPGTPWPGEVPVILFGRSASQQSVSFQTDFRPRYGGAIFGFSGPADSLFDGLDIGTLRVDPTAPLRFSAYMSIPEASMTLSVDADRFTFRVSPPVPEAPAAWTLAAGLTLLAGAMRRRQVAVSTPTRRR